MKLFSAALHRYGSRIAISISIAALTQLGGVNAFAAAGHLAVHLSNNSRSGAACKANNVDHVYVTFSDVQAHRSGKGGFQSLIGAPAPEQFDLMFAGDEPNEPIGSADCPIVGLGGTGLPAGKYQQIRLITVNNGASNGADPIIPTDQNACASLGDKIYNCVDANGTLAPLTIPSGGNTGLKIPPGQAGPLKIADGQSVDLDIDVDPCSSLVVKGKGASKGKGHGHGKGGGGSYSLKPTLHGGEIALNPVISGQVVLGTDSGPDTTVTAGDTAVPNANVWLELEANVNTSVGDPAFDNGDSPVPTNSVVASATTDSNGNFIFCPVPVGNYDIVVDAETVPTAAHESDATITTGVSVTAKNGRDGIVIPVIEGSTDPVTLTLEVTTQATGGGAGVGDDIDFFGTQGFGTNSPVNQAEIPPYSGTSLEPQTTVGTGCGNTCPANTNCVCFDVAMPADNPVTGVVGGPYTSGSGAANYSLLANANVQATSTPACTPSQLITLPGTSPLPQPTLSFTNCD